MKKILDTQEANNSKKKQEFENLNIKSLDLQNLISLNSMVSDIENCFGSLMQRSKFNS